MSEGLKELRARDVVRRILEDSVKAQTAFPAARGCLETNSSLACSSAGEPIRLDLVDRRSAAEAALRDRLKRARKEGDLPASSDCAMLASYVMTVIHGMAVQAKTGATRATLEAVVKHVLSTWPVSESAD
jgi:hypothetical protein